MIQEHDKLGEKELSEILNSEDYSKYKKMMTTEGSEESAGMDVLNETMADGTPRVPLEAKYNNFIAEITTNDMEELIFHFFPVVGRRFKEKFKATMEYVFKRAMKNYEERLSFGKLEEALRASLPAGEEYTTDSYFIVIKGFGNEDSFSSLFEKRITNPMKELDRRMNEPGN